MVITSEEKRIKHNAAQKKSYEKKMQKPEFRQQQIDKTRKVQL